MVFSPIVIAHYFPTVCQHFCGADLVQPNSILLLWAETQLTFLLPLSFISIPHYSPYPVVEK